VPGEFAGPPLDKLSAGTPRKRGSPGFSENHPLTRTGYFHRDALSMPVINLMSSSGGSTAMAKGTRTLTFSFRPADTPDPPQPGRGHTSIHERFIVCHLGRKRAARPPGRDG
jgi:hypothetical protein